MVVVVVIVISSLWVCVVLMNMLLNWKFYIDMIGSNVVYIR